MQDAEFAFVGFGGGEVGEGTEPDVEQPCEDVVDEPPFVNYEIRRGSLVAVCGRARDPAAAKG